MVVSLSVAASAFGIACLATYLLARPGGWLQLLDHPNERSLHGTPIPRTGGLAIWAGGFAGVTIVLFLRGVHSEIAWIASAALVVGSVSFIDDRFHVPAGLRLAVHMLAGGLLLIGGLSLHFMRLPGCELALPAVLGLPLTLLFVIWMTNLYNFMDGMDGFAGGMAVFGFGTFGLLAYLAGNEVFAAVSWSVAAAAGGFLVSNFPPARIFMGDTGASALGVMAGAMSLWADHAGLFPLWISMLVFSPFVVDATVTLIRRVVRREQVWEAHRNHHYQRLVRLGWGHKKTVLVEYVLMVGCSISAVLLINAPVTVQWLGIGVWGLIYAIGMCVVTKLEANAR